MLRPHLLIMVLFVLCLHYLLSVPEAFTQEAETEPASSSEDTESNDWIDPDSFFDEWEDDAEEIERATDAFEGSESEGTENDPSSDIELDTGAVQAPNLATGSIDDLFADAESGIIEDDADAEGIDVEAITADPVPRVTGRVRSRGGVNIGLRDWENWKDGTNDPRDVIGAGGLFAMDARLSLDYRPTGYQRLFTSLKSEMDQDTLEFSQPEIGELFVDYTYRQNYFFRAGKQGLTWGQARLLVNKANLVSNLGGGIGLRAVAPVRSGLTVVLYTTESYRSDADGSAGLRAFGYAGQLESSLGSNSSFGLSSHYRYTQPLRTAAYHKSSMGGVDFTVEGVTAWDIEEAYRSDEIRSLDPVFSGLANIAWASNSTPRLRVIAEYQFDGAVPDYQGNRVGLALRLTELSWTRWSVNLRWRHSFFSNSGDAVLGMSGSVAPGISANVGIPVFYRGPDFLGDAEDEDIPDEYFLSALLTLSMTISF